MDFLKRYYDKLLLGVLLLTLVAVMVALSSSLNKAREAVEIDDSGMMRDITGKPPMEEIDMSQFQATIETDPKRLWVADPADADSSLMGPGRYVYALDGSGYILHFTDRINEFTQTPDVLDGDSGEIDNGGDDPIPPTPPDPIEDSERDGLPDAWEAKHGLSNRMFDQFTDNDRDGFTAAEEFAAQTNPSDAASFPPLASLVRFYQEEASLFPYELRKVKPIDPDDKSTWEVDIRHWKGSHSRDYLGLKLNAVLPMSDFRIQDGVLQYHEVQNVKYDNHEIILESASTGEKIKLPTGRRIPHGKTSVVLANVILPARLQRIQASPGETVTLTGAGGVTQAYTLSEGPPYALVDANGRKFPLATFDSTAAARRIQPARPAPPQPLQP